MAVNEEKIFAIVVYRSSTIKHFLIGRLALINRCVSRKGKISYVFSDNFQLPVLYRGA